MLNDLYFAFFNLPIPFAGPCRTRSQLTIHSPVVREPFVFGMVKNGNVSQIVASFYLHTNIHPHRTLPFGFFVLLPRRVNHITFDSLFPRHSDKQSAVIVFPNGDISLSFACPFQIQQVFAILFTHYPRLSFGQYGSAFFIQ